MSIASSLPYLLHAGAKSRGKQQHYDATVIPLWIHTVSGPYHFYGAYVSTSKTGLYGKKNPFLSVLFVLFI